MFRVHSAKVLFIGVTDLFPIVLRMHFDVQNQTASACVTFPVTSCLSLENRHISGHLAVTEGEGPPAVQHRSFSVKLDLLL